MIEDARVNAAYEYCKKQVGKDDYRTRIRNMPGMIKTSGMAAATAFLFSKQEVAPYRELYQNIEEWLRKKMLIEKEPGLMEQLTTMDSEKYQMVTMETMALLNWMKRFADAFCKVPDKKGE